MHGAGFNCEIQQSSDATYRVYDWDASALMESQGLYVEKRDVSDTSAKGGVAKSIKSLV